MLHKMRLTMNFRANLYETDDKWYSSWCNNWDQTLILWNSKFQLAGGQKG